VGADCTSVSLSPNGETQGVRDSDPLPLFLTLAEVLSAIGISYLELREPPLDGSFGQGYLSPRRRTPLPPSWFERERTQASAGRAEPAKGLRRAQAEPSGAHAQHTP